MGRVVWRAGITCALLLWGAGSGLGCGQTGRTVGGRLTGLHGTVGLGLGNQRLTLKQNGPYNFPGELAQGTGYHVVVQTQPAGQVCTVTNSSGTMGGGPITNVNVSCSAINTSGSYHVSVAVTGLNGVLQLLNNSTDLLSVARDGTYTFATPLNGGTNYLVTIMSQPSGQACVLGETASGTIGSSDVTVTITCALGFVINGTVTYDRVPTAGSAQGGPKLNYAAKTVRPARRVTIQAVDDPTGVVLTESQTLDDGSYTIQIPQGLSARIYVLARSRTNSAVPDGIAPDQCQNAKWDLNVVDNTQPDGQGNPSLYVLATSTSFSGPGTQNLHAVTSYSGGAYTERSGVPFSLLDVALQEIEMLCHAAPALALPQLFMEWSPNNVNVEGDVTQGQIGTSFYSSQPDNVSRLFLLGEEDVDTDEYDDHVVAHEFGHFVEDRLSRSDSVGGNHLLGDVLSPPLAFSEGYANAISGMAFNNPLYIDTNGTGQALGFEFDVSVAPTGNDRGIYSETSVQYFLWSLFKNNAATIDRIYPVLSVDHAFTSALTSLHSFAAYYNQRFGDAQGLKTLWTTALASPWDALCAGACAAGGNTADVFDTDNDIGTAYSATRFYPPGTSTSQSADFWRLYRTFTASITGNDHDSIVGYGPDGSNKWGAVRSYRFNGNTQTTIDVGTLGDGKLCSANWLDLYVLRAGALLALDNTSTGSTAGCPHVVFAPSSEQDVVIEMLGPQGNVSSWNLTVVSQ